MTGDELREFLDFKAAEYEHPRFIESDPIQLVHRFTRKEDIEIVGLLMATIAWGNRTSIIKSGEKLLTIMQQDPYAFVTAYGQDLQQDLQFVHRTFNSVDLDFFFRSLKRLYANGGPEQAFGPHPDIPGVKGRIVRFRELFIGQEAGHRSLKHISDPLRNSAAKRLNMFLRWMSRPATRGVDFGIWDIPSSELYLPLDVHTGNNARRLGLLTRTQNDWKALEELMAALRAFDEKDPVKYDFALFGLGAFENFK